ncbi:iron ABC transporter permease [Paenibacillus sp. NFR01]|uniref:FecCD family ABC transporter permease n=1 Tax=Paenibacillus sp. NFR01 TaxID=1566279 RepID=UPI0008BC6A4E|nr:iron ABC transporter permease [Paenibacillus sp. NFR01]SEU23179.1 bacillibactin ABC transporter integral membrane protein [Paenibacillus sp. NFR01]
MPNGSKSRFWLVMIALAAVILVVGYINLTSGLYDLSVREVLRTLFRLDRVPENDLVIFEFRLPRIVLSLLVGYSLGLAGAVIQGITRNPLADPGILGINAGAGTAVVLFMFLLQGSMDGTGGSAVLAMPLFGLLGGLAATALIYVFARHHGVIEPQRLILVGIAIASGFGAVTTYLSLKMNSQDFEKAAVWLSGSIYSANWKFVVLMLPWMLVFVPLLLTRSKVLDVFQLEEQSVRGLGVRVERERNFLLLGSIGLVSASVSVSGSIGFVGLIGPHIARRLVGLQHRWSLPVSGLTGALMVVAGDYIGRTLFAPTELAAGTVISLIGVPYFVFLLIRAR